MKIPTVATIALTIALQGCSAMKTVGDYSAKALDVAVPVTLIVLAGMDGYYNGSSSYDYSKDKPTVVVNNYIVAPVTRDVDVLCKNVENPARKAYMYNYCPAGWTRTGM